MPMSMEEMARQAIQRRDDEDQERSQRLQEWQRRTIEELTPVLTEYARALVKVRFRPEETRWRLWYEPTLVLVGKDHQEGDDKATCKFIVHDSGSWSWLSAPKWHDRYDPVPVSGERVMYDLTGSLSAAMEIALPD
jgi:hypothetical protein